MEQEAIGYNILLYNYILKIFIHLSPIIYQIRSKSNDKKQVTHLCPLPLALFIRKYSSAVFACFKWSMSLCPLRKEELATRASHLTQSCLNFPMVRVSIATTIPSYQVPRPPWLT